MSLSLEAIPTLEFGLFPENKKETSEIFSSKEAFYQGFINGLENLLRNPDLCSFNIALANALQKPEILRVLRPELKETWQTLCGGNLNCEDRPFFDFISHNNWENLQPIMQETKEGWRINIQPLRSFKKPNAAGQIINTIFPPKPYPSNFFNREGIKKQLLYEGDLAGREAFLFFNKYPFYFGGLLTYGIDEPHPQLLKAEDLQWLWQITSELAERFPDLYLGYNSYGASCSIADGWHLHFILRDQPYPVEAGYWRHNGGERNYPMDCWVSNSCDESLNFLSFLKENNLPHNLIHKEGKDFWFPRRFQDPLNRQAFSELGGEIVSDGSLAFNRSEEIERFLANVKLN